MLQHLKDPYDIPKAAQCTLQFDKNTISSFLEMGFSLPESLNKAVAKRQSEYLAGRYCAKQALLSLNAPIQALGQLGEKNRAPLWPANFVGSISHSHGLARAVVARAEDFLSIGIDSEKLVSKEQAVKLKDHICYPLELTLGEKLGIEASFSLIFSAKESIFKAINPLVGVFFGYMDASLVEIGSDYFVFKLERELSPAFYSGYSHRGYFKIDYPFVHTSVCLDKD